MSEKTVSNILDQLFKATSVRDLDRINGYRAAAKDFGRLTEEESTVLYNTITRFHSETILRKES